MISLFICYIHIFYLHFFWVQSENLPKYLMSVKRRKLGQNIVWVCVEVFLIILCVPLITSKSIITLLKKEISDSKGRFLMHQWICFGNKDLASCVSLTNPVYCLVLVVWCDTCAKWQLKFQKKIKYLGKWMRSETSSIWIHQTSSKSLNLREAFRITKLSKFAVITISKGPGHCKKPLCFLWCSRPS